jgi:hypothetical protein
MDGWIKLHRKILDNPISHKPEYAWLWTTLLLLANHDDNKFIFNGNEEIVKRGQILTGREKLSSQTGIKPTNIENILKYLEKCGQIGQQKTNKFRLITVIKYNEYQDIGQQSDNKVTTNRQQSDTNKNVKNDKNVKKSTPSSQFTSLDSIDNDEVMQEIADHYRIKLLDVKKTYDAMYLWAKSKGKVYKNYKAGLMNWVVKRMEENKIKVIS